MIELGCCAFSFGVELEDSLRLARYLDFRFVDISASGATAQVDPESAAEAPERVGAEMRQMAAKYEVELVELFATTILVDGQAVQVTEPDHGLRDKLVRNFGQLCRFAVAAGFESVMGVPGRHQESLGDSGTWDVAAETLSRMTQVAGGMGIALNVEPSSSSILSTPAAALRMARDVPGLAYTLDYAHYVGQGIPLDEIMPLHASTRHIHAKAARPGLLKSFAHHNAIDFCAVIADLGARGWDGVMSLECIGRPSGDPAITHPLYQEVSQAEGTLPPVPGMVSHPLYQVIELARELQRYGLSH